MLQHHRESTSIPGAAEHGALFTPSFSTGPVADRPVSTTTRTELEAAVEYILGDVFFNIGQGVGQRKAIEHGALMWWRDRYRAKFMRAMTSFGNTWLIDRPRVVAMCRMLADRAVEYAKDDPTITLDSASKASQDVEQFCVKHAIRKARRLGQPTDVHRPEMFAGYWCAM